MFVLLAVENKFEGAPDVLDVVFVLRPGNRDGFEVLVDAPAVALKPPKGLVVVVLLVLVAPPKLKPVVPDVGAAEEKLNDGSVETVGAELLLNISGGFVFADTNIDLRRPDASCSGGGALIVVPGRDGKRDLDDEVEEMSGSDALLCMISHAHRLFVLPVLAFLPISLSRTILWMQAPARVACWASSIWSVSSLGDDHRSSCFFRLSALQQVYHEPRL